MAHDIKQWKEAESGDNIYIQRARQTTGETELQYHKRRKGVWMDRAFILLAVLSLSVAINVYLLMHLHQ